MTDTARGKSMRVTYEKYMRERAKAERKWLVTISVSGKHLGDDSCTVQAVVDLPMAQKLTRQAVELLKRRSDD